MSERQQSPEEPIEEQTGGSNPEFGPEQNNDMTEQLLPPVIHFDKYREPLLEYEDQER